MDMVGCQTEHSWAGFTSEYLIMQPQTLLHSLCKAFHYFALENCGKLFLTNLQGQNANVYVKSTGNYYNILNRQR